MLTKPGLHSIVVVCMHKEIKETMTYVIKSTKPGLHSYRR
jgi:hypothetical protein